MPISGFLDSPWGPIEWRASDEPLSTPRHTNPQVKELTVEEQAYEDVKSYFAWLGKAVPTEEIAWCEEAIRLEAEVLARPPPVFEAPPRVATDEKPEYGTPEFWAWCRRTKKDREAKKAAEEAEKEAKRKEKEAEKLAVKQAKENAKAAKEAEKQAKESAKAAKAAALEAKKAAKNNK